MGRGGVQEVIRVFFYCELNVWMVTVEIFKKSVRGIGFSFASNFLDTAFTHQDGNFTTEVHQKPGKLQVHWKSAIPHKWKRNTILGALHRAKRIATNWQEVQAIKQSFIRSGHPAKLVNEVINDFENPTARDDETIIPVHWFDERTKIGIQLPF